MHKRLAAIALSAIAALSVSSAHALTSDVSGLIRIKGLFLNLQQREDAGDKPDKLVNTRFRAKWTGTVNEYLSATYFGEIDFEWGDASFQTARNQGGGFEADSVNLETKNVYITWKIPDTPMVTTWGIQGIADNWNQFLLLNDAAGIRADFKNLGAAGNLSLAWYKLFEGDPNFDKGAIGQANLEDDVNLYMVQWAPKPMGRLKFGADFYYFLNQRPDDGRVESPGTINGSGSHTGVGAPEGTFLTPGREDIFFLGVDASYQLLDNLKLSGWAVYNFGTMENLPQPDKITRVSAFALSARADMVGNGWGSGLHTFYFPADKDNTDKKMTAIRNPVSQTVSTTGAFRDAPSAPFGNDNLILLLADSTGALAAGTNPFAIKDGSLSGYGTWGVAWSGSYSPTIVRNSYVKAGLGYFRTLINDRIKESAPAARIKDRDGKTIGTEVALRVGMRSAKNLDISLNAAYAWLGDFYNNSVTNWQDTAGGAGLRYAANRKDPDNPYALYWMVNLDF